MGARVGCEARCENTDVLDGERRGPRESEGAIDLHRELTKVEEMRVGLGLTAPPAKKFAGRLVWDVAYSAGFNWGDGDYFHWVPSPNS